MGERPDEAAMLRSFLAGRDEPCPQCGYNLRDLTGSRCPECGEELTLRLQPVDPRQAAALAGLICLAAGGGMNFLLLGYWVISVAFLGRGGSDPWLNRFVVINLCGLLALGTCVALWLWHWRKIRRLHAARRWMLAAACAMLSMADLIIFTKMIR